MNTTGTFQESERPGNTIESNQVDHKKLNEEALERLEQELEEQAKKDMFQALIDLDFTSSDEISLKKIINLQYTV